jgi:hypothetical protein
MAARGIMTDRVLSLKAVCGAALGIEWSVDPPFAILCLRPEGHEGRHQYLDMERAKEIWWTDDGSVEYVSFATLTY